MLIIAGDADGNLGDTAIALSTCDALRALQPDVCIHGVSGLPRGNPRVAYDVCIPKGLRGVPALIRAARRSDLVLCGGGGLFQDDDSLAKMPYWAVRLLLVRLFAHRIVGYSIGAGPIRAWISRLATRVALACLQSISVRDEPARQTLELLTRKAIARVPDPALLLTPASREEAERLLREHDVPLDSEQPLIGVCLRQWYGEMNRWIPHKYAYRLGLQSSQAGMALNDRLMSFMATELDQVGEALGAFFVFLPSYNVPHENDAEICLEVMQRMRYSAKRLICLDDARLYKATTGCLRLLIAGRMHPAILAADMGVRSVGLAYNQKFGGFFEQIGQGHALVSLKALLQTGQTGEVLSRVRCQLDQADDWQNRVAGLKSEIDTCNRALFGSL